MSMRITIGMPSYENHEQVWWTCQALKIYQDVQDCEILVVDNKGSKDLEKVCSDVKVRYELYNEVVGTAPVRNKIFERARRPFVLVIDSHVMLWPDAIGKLRAWLSDNWEKAKNLIQGPLVLSSLGNAYTHYEPQWRKDMWGIWPTSIHPDDIPDKPCEIGMMGLGLFGCRQDSWLKFHPLCKGFDGVEGVIHEKYRQAGRKTLCLPFLKWVHKFGRSGNFPLLKDDKIRNFLLGFDEIGLDPTPVYDHFGKELVGKIHDELKRQGLATGQGNAIPGGPNVDPGLSRDDMRCTAGDLHDIR